jgi:hypothetical protein
MLEVCNLNGFMNDPEFSYFQKCRGLYQEVVNELSNSLPDAVVVFLLRKTSHYKMLMAIQLGGDQFGVLGSITLPPLTLLPLTENAASYVRLGRKTVLQLNVEGSDLKGLDWSLTTAYVRSRLLHTLGYIQRVLMEGAESRCRIYRVEKRGWKFILLPPKTSSRPACYEWPLGDVEPFAPQ